MVLILYEIFIVLPMKNYRKSKRKGKKIKKERNDPVEIKFLIFKYGLNIEKIDYDKQKKAEQAIDQLRKRFGQDIIKRASFLPTNHCENTFIDHMGGGISREKRTVDYSKEDIK